MIFRVRVTSLKYFPTMIGFLNIFNIINRLHWHSHDEIKSSMLMSLFADYDFLSLFAEKITDFKMGCTNIYTQAAVTREIIISK